MFCVIATRISTDAIIITIKTGSITSPMADISISEAGDVRESWTNGSINVVLINFINRILHGHSTWTYLNGIGIIKHVMCSIVRYGCNRGVITS